MELKIDGIAAGGVGYSESDTERIHVAGALPGDRVEVSRPRSHRGRTQARLIRVLDREIASCQAPCEHFGRCGGCDWMDLPYDVQLSLKTRMVADAFLQVGLTVDLAEIVASPEEYRYRNRVDFAFGNGQTGPVIGLYEKGDPRDRSHALPPVCPVEDCWLTSDTVNGFGRQVQEALVDTHLKAYNPESRTGVLRSLEIREGEAGGAINLLVANDKHLSEDLLTRVADGAEAMTLRVSRTRSRHAKAKRERVIRGEGEPMTTILGARIAFGGTSFSQVNRFLLDGLYGLAIELARPSASDRVLDLYCGVGALSIPLAKRSAHVVGIELDGQAVQCAQSNAATNACANTRFVSADATKLSAWGDGPFSLVTLNPPRGGLDAGVVEGVASSRPDRVVYVSCNPDTLARDCKRLSSNNYTVSAVHPVDMFPQTAHVETVVRLDRNHG